jgi:hypothetical protein
MAGRGMPLCTAAEITRRQAPWAFSHLRFEVGILQQVAQDRDPYRGLLDFPQESRTDDTAAAPHERHAAVIEIPVIFLRGGAHEHVTLRIGNDLGSIQRVVQVVQQRVFIAGDERLRAFQHLRGIHALFLQGDNPRLKHGFDDQGKRDASSGVDPGPLAGAFWAGLVIEDFVQPAVFPSCL